jgi:2-polyprenyl-6-methoxyphenol hydroxylase-like FAD-dependent oxidoreductase
MLATECRLSLGASANMGMLDAVQLADHLTSTAFADLAQALSAFEQGITPAGLK